MAGRVNTPGASVTGRVLSILDCFNVAHPTLTLSQIALHSGIPLSTVRRLVAELEEWGALERLVDKHYRVGIRLWELGSLAPQQRDLRDVALPSMHDLYSATQENVQLVVIDGYEALCIEKISGKKAVPTRTEVGGRLPLHATAVGKSILAFSPIDLLNSLYERGLRRHTPYTITELGRLAAVLREARRKGVSYSHEEMSVGAISVASPIVSPGGILHGSLGIVVRSTSNLDALAPAVRTAALGISRACG
ncbi:IclR family transcriptional regulator [Streptomyces sp. GESEQ-35]|uniref:IclR family transcriptional regulator n=1 Tax=Streptomyces sp. GESEQ-35 TaxID=2812657 RepID=UPI001B32F28E|nr:IclR family transcriptional regulator [Streptomyces sp. GESEQ-35]